MEQPAEASHAPQPLVFSPPLVPLRGRSLDTEVARAGEAVEPAPYRILVVEDEPSFLELMLPLLQHRYPVVDTASDGYQAQKLLQQTAYDLVLTDLHMPQVDGLALLAWIKRQQPDLNVIVMTGELSPEAEQEARQKGATNFLAKPFTSKKLLAAIDLCHRKQKPPRARSGNPAALLLKPLIHDMAAGLENAAITLQMLQRSMKGAGAETCDSRLESMNSKLFQLMGLTEEYCSLLHSLDQNGEIPCGRYDLQVDTIEVVLNELEHEIRRKKISVKCRRNKNLAYRTRLVQANRVLLHSAFRTLFANAIKHCRQGGMISYGFSDTDKEYQLHISHEGEPLTETMRLADRIGVKTGKGTGYGNSGELFGLSAAHAVFRQYGGSLTCEPARGGSRFLVTIPRRPSARTLMSCPAGQ